MRLLLLLALLGAAPAAGAVPAADRALLLGAHAEAAAAYARAAAAAPAGSAERLAARYGEGLARLSARDATKARAAFAEVAAAEHPEWSRRAAASLGDALLAAGRPGEAVEAYRAYLVRFPGGEEEPWVYAQAARALAAAGRRDEARAFRSEIARRWPALAAEAP